ncbi:MAG: hypothetical protein Kow0031_33620 [Anaerolineae bacterium]
MSYQLTPGMLFAQRYLLTNLIGQGGIGHVWLAQDTNANMRAVALKFPKPEFRQRAAFIAEARLMSQFSHNNIIKIYHSGRHPDFGEFYAMEYFPDGSLVDFLLKPDCDFAHPIPGHPELRYVPLNGIEPILRPIAQALDYVHHNHPGVYHRDLKLSNILVDRANGRYVLTDFSLNVGAPAIMSPEQLLEWKGPADQRQPVDWRSDLYAFGACVYKLATGSYPFPVTSAPTSLEAVDELYRYQLVDRLPVTPPVERNPDNPDLHNPHVNALLMQLTSKSRSGRTLMGRVTSIEQALDELLQARLETGPLPPQLADTPLTDTPLTTEVAAAPARHRDGPPVFALAVFVLALLLLAGGVITASLASFGDDSGSAGRAQPAAAKESASQQSLAGYPTATPLPSATPPPEEAATGAPPSATPTSPPVEASPTPPPQNTLPPPTATAPPTQAPVAVAGPPLQCEEGLSLLNPQPGQTVSGEVEFAGVINLAELDYIKVEYLPPGSQQWSCCLVDPTDPPPGSNTLGRWDTAAAPFAPGEYGIRLVAVKPDGNFNICETRVTVQK